MGFPSVVSAGGSLTGLLHAVYCIPTINVNNAKMNRVYFSINMRNSIEVVQIGHEGNDFG